MINKILKIQLIILLGILIFIVGSPFLLVLFFAFMAYKIIKAILNTIISILS